MNDTKFRANAMLRDCYYCESGIGDGWVDRKDQTHLHSQTDIAGAIYKVGTF